MTLDEFHDLLHKYQVPNPLGGVWIFRDILNKHRRTEPSHNYDSVILHILSEGFKKGRHNEEQETLKAKEKA